MGVCGVTRRSLEILVIAVEHQGELVQLLYIGRFKTVEHGAPGLTPQHTDADAGEGLAGVGHGRARGPVRRIMGERLKVRVGVGLEVATVDGAFVRQNRNRSLIPHEPGEIVVKR